MKLSNINSAVSLCAATLLTALLLCALATTARCQEQEDAPVQLGTSLPKVAPGTLRYTAKGEIVVPIIFPVLGGARWSDTYGAPRDGGRRQHAGQDLPGPKMRPLVACFDGIWYGSSLVGDNGCTTRYLHINNDNPGTDDGKGGDEFAYAPGVYAGARVRAGQHVAYCGDSGNAEDTISHLHFELEVGHKTINAAASLRAATVLKQARYPLPLPNARPSTGQLRVDGEVVALDAARGMAQIRVAGWVNADGKTTPQTRPTRRWVHLSDTADPSAREPLATLAPGDFVAAFGQDGGGGKPIETTRLVFLHHNEEARQRAANRRQDMSPVPLASGMGILPVTAIATPATSRHPNSAATVAFDFEQGGYDGWERSGDCWGYGPEGAGFAGRALTGWQGSRFATTAHARSAGMGPESGSGRAVSASFVIPADATALRFRIAGGRHPNRCCLNLIVGGIVVRTATGESPYQMRLAAWDITDLHGKTAWLEIHDDLRVGAHAYIHMDDIKLVRAGSAP